MFLAWAFLVPIGIHFAAHERQLGDVWFYTHVRVMLAAFVLILVSFIIIVVATSPGPHFDCTHAICGLVVVIVTVLQILLGYVIDKVFNEKRTSVPWHDRLHWWTGRLLFVLAIVAISLGLNEYSERYSMSSAVIGLWYFWIFGVVCVGFLGLFGYYRH